jgi:hypothetical protein
VREEESKKRELESGCQSSAYQEQTLSKKQEKLYVFYKEKLE